MSGTATVTEADIMADVIGPERGDLPPAVAQSVLTWKFPQRSLARMDQLAGRNRCGSISPTERDEWDKYLRVGSLIHLRQAKARLR